MNTIIKTYARVTQLQANRNEMNLVSAARGVLEYDWSDNDEDAVATISELHEALKPYPSEYSVHKNGD